MNNLLVFLSCSAFNFFDSLKSSTLSAAHHLLMSCVEAVMIMRSSLIIDQWIFCFNIRLQKRRDYEKILSQKAELLPPKRRKIHMTQMWLLLEHPSWPAFPLLSPIIFTIDWTMILGGRISRFFLTSMISLSNWMLFMNCMRNWNDCVWLNSQLVLLESIYLSASKLVQVGVSWQDAKCAE